MVIQKYWQEIRETADRLRTAIALTSRQPRDGTCFLTSTFGPPGRITECVIYEPGNAGSGAKCVFDGSHKLASDEEIFVYQTNMAARRRDRAAGVAAGTTKVL